MSNSEPLTDVHILVAEDEFFLADDLARTLRDLGAVVIGPAPTVQKALSLLQENARVDLAVLDINLRDAFIYPVAESAGQREIPYLFTTGYDQGTIPDQYRAVPRVNKPYDPNEVVGHLLGMLH